MLLVKKKGRVDEFTDLHALALLTVRLFDDATSAEKSELGITILERSAEKSTEEPGLGICQICGEPIALDSVFCRSCKTAHHRDCWEYNGACSTYGCSQKRFVTRQGRKKKRASRKYR